MSATSFSSRLGLSGTLLLLSSLLCPLLLHAQMSGEAAQRFLDERRQLIVPYNDAYMLAEQAEHLADQGKLPEATATATRALAMYDKLGPDNKETQKLLSLLGKLYLDQHRMTDAKAAFQRLFAVYRKWRPAGPLTSEDALLAMNALNQYYYNVGDYAEAARWAQQAVDGSPGYIALSLNLAMALLAQKTRSSEAYEIVRKALAHSDEVLADMTVETTPPSIKIRGASDRHSAVLLLADAAWSMSQTDPGSADDLKLEVFKRLQWVTTGPAALSIAESAGRRYASDRGGADLLRQRAALGEQVSAARKQNIAELDQFPLGDKRRRESDDRFFKVWARVFQQQKDLSAQIEARAPQYFAIVNHPALTVSQGQALLRDDEAVLLVVPSVFGTHVMAVTKQGLTWNRSPLKSDKIDTMVGWLRRDLDPTGDKSGTGLPGFDRNTAYHLYVSLIAPMNEVIAGKTHLFIIARGALASLPFGVLVTQVPKPGEDDSDPTVLRDTHWFADEHALIEIPSLQSMAYIRMYDQQSRGGGRHEPFVGYGDPKLAGSDQTRGARGGSPAITGANRFVGGAGNDAAPLMNPDELRKLPSLSGTHRELNEIQKVLGGSLHLQEQMTEHAIKSDARAGRLAHTRIIDIATHGLTVRESGTRAEPGLVFTPPAQATPEDDGYLSASEIVGLNLVGTEWVILSACNSAAPSDLNPESSLSGLASAFLYAGAPELLVSHWPVHDSVAATLAIETLRNADQGGISKAQALQAAMRTVREQPGNVHPSVWAPFTLVGDR